MTCTHRTASEVSWAVVGLRCACALVVLTLAQSARADEPQWEVGAAAQAGLAGDTHGFGAIVHGLYRSTPYLAFGGLVDVMHLSGGGDRALNGKPYSLALVSTYVAGVAQLRAPLGAWMPFVELGAGALLNATLESVNNQCSAPSGATLSVSGGLNVQLARNVAVGVRGGGRLSLGRCDQALGPASLLPGPVLVTAAAGVQARW